jgi:hypothetical protein
MRAPHWTQRVLAMPRLPVLGEFQEHAGMVDLGANGDPGTR